MESRRGLPPDELLLPLHAGHQIARSFATICEGLGLPRLMDGFPRDQINQAFPMSSSSRNITAVDLTASSNLLPTLM